MIKRLVKASDEFKGIYEQYEIHTYTINTPNKALDAQLIHLIPNSNGIIDIKHEHYTVFNDTEFIIDPNWNEESKPIPKPKNFDMEDLSTWDGLLLSDIPMINNPDKLYFEIFEEYLETSSIYEAIFKILIFTGKLPKVSDKWKLI